MEVPREVVGVLGRRPNMLIIITSVVVNFFYVNTSGSGDTCVYSVEICPISQRVL